MYLLTNLLNPLRAELHIRPSPENANVIYLQNSVIPGPDQFALNPSFLYPCFPWSSSFPFSIRCTSHCHSIPSGVHLIATLVIDDSFILFTCPIHLHLRRLISTGMGTADILTCQFLFDMVFGQNMFNILLRHLF